MQHYSGGWTYWEGDTDAEPHITPYVLRSLIAFRHLGQMIPDSVLENGAKYIITNLSSYRQDPDSFAEAVWTLALLGHTPEALEASKSIDVKSLTRHGYLAYAAAAEILAITPPDMVAELDRVMFSTGGRDDSWYWDRSADQAIYAGLLIDRGDTLKGYALIDRIVRSTDLTSNLVSIQMKIQVFRAILKQIEKSGKLLQKSLPMAFRSDTLIVDASLTPVKTTRTIESTREKIGGSFTLKRDDARLPIYITVTTRDRTKSIIDMPPENTLGMNIVRTFELVDESK